MKLVLYSGYDEDNSPIDCELLRLVGKTQPKVTFIPSAHYVPEYEFNYFCETFAEYGVRDVRIFNVDQPYSPLQLDQAMAADLIYLSGGNTFYFLKAILRQKFDEEIRKFIARGGVLAGLSAGAIVMTPTIATASYPKFDRDENNVGLKNFTALHLVDFEVFPHYAREPEYCRELKKQSKRIDYPLYGVADGGGVVVDQDRVSFFGEVWGYVDGKEFKVR